MSDEEVALATAFVGLAQLTDFEAAHLIERNHFRTGETPHFNGASRPWRDTCRVRVRLGHIFSDETKALEELHVFGGAFKMMFSGGAHAARKRATHSSSSSKHRTASTSHQSQPIPMPPPPLHLFSGVPVSGYSPGPPSAIHVPSTGLRDGRQNRER